MNKNVEVDYSDLYEMVTLAYSRWTTEFDLLKKVKAERNDGSTDWEQFHSERLRNHTEAEAKWKALLERNTKILNLNAR